MEFKHVQSLQTEKYKTLPRDFKSLNKRYDIPCFRVKLVQNGFSKGKNSKHDKKKTFGQCTCLKTYRKATEE